MECSVEIEAEKKRRKKAQAAGSAKVAIRKRIYTAVLGITVFLVTPVFCMAGTMNGNEQYVYSAAQKTFIYEGESYVAAGEYLSQLSSYLCRDDVDLTAEQAMAAVAQMNSNVAEGVAKGYIVPVGSSGGGDGSQGSGNPGEDNPDGEETGKKDNPGENSNGTGNGNSEKDSDGNSSGDGGTEEEESTSADDVSMREALLDQQRVDEGPLDKRPVDADDAQGAFYFDNESGTIRNGFLDEDNKGTDEAVSFGSICFEKEYLFMKYIVPAGFILAAAAWVILAVGSCLRFQKEKHGAHTRRKRCARAGGVLNGIALGMGVAVLLIPLVLQTNVLKNDKIVSDLGKSGFYSNTYLELMDEIHGILNEAGCLESTCDEILSYEKFRFDSSNYLQMDLEGKENTATLDITKKDIINAVDSVVYFTDEDKEKLATSILESYRTQVNSGVGGAFYEAKQYFAEYATTYLIAAAVLAAICVVGMFVTRQPIKKAIGSIGIGLVLAGAAFVAAAAYFIVKDVYAGYYIQPDYLYLFFYTHMTEGMRQYLIPGIAALAAGCFCLLQKRER